MMMINFSAYRLFPIIGFQIITEKSTDNLPDADMSNFRQPKRFFSQSKLFLWSNIDPKNSALFHSSRLNRDLLEKKLRVNLIVKLS
jgi:hypothetical protein